MEKPQFEPSGLEASLLQLFHDHHIVALCLCNQNGEERGDEECGEGIGLPVELVNGGVQELFLNEKRIELEIQLLAATIIRFMKLTDQWLAASHAINTVIKEIGDFENWMRTMEFDCRRINAAIRNIHQE